MPNKTRMSRFPIHDDLTAPEESLPILKGLTSSAGQLPNFLGALANSAVALRGYVRFRGELRRGALPAATKERIGIAVATHLNSKPNIALHERTARRAGIGIDEIAAARDWHSSDAREAAMLRYVRPLAEQRREHPVHLHEEAHEAGWTDEQLLEAIALVSLEGFTAMINLAGEIPVDGSVEETRLLRAA